MLAYQKVKCLFVELPRCYRRAAIGGQRRSFPERERSPVWRPTGEGASFSFGNTGDVNEEGELRVKRHAHGRQG